MAQKKETPESPQKKRTVKMQDLAPRKDAKGGATTTTMSKGGTLARLDPSG